MKQIYQARDSMEAHFLVGLLEAEGIEASVAGEAVNAMISVTSDMKPTVLVKEEDVERAMPIVADLKNRDKADANLSDDVDAPTSAQAWTCPNCGEKVEPQFDACWNCGKARP